MVGVDIHTRLEEFGTRLAEVQKRLALRRRIPADHQITSEELQDRYQTLLQDVGDNPAASDRLGRNLTDIEYALKLWRTQLDNEEL